MCDTGSIMQNQMDDLISSGLSNKDILENELTEKNKLILDLTQRNSDLIKDNKQAWEIIQEYRGDVWSGEHLSINQLNAEIKRLQDELMHLMINTFGEIERRQIMILKEKDGIVRETMINNLLIDLLPVR